MDTQFDRAQHTTSTTPVSVTAMASDGDILAPLNAHRPLDSMHQLGSALPDPMRSLESPSASGATSTISATATSGGANHVSGHVNVVNGTTFSHSMSSIPAMTAMSNENVNTVSSLEPQELSDKPAFGISSSSLGKLEKVPRYAQPTMASIRREAATLRALSESNERVNRPPPKWPREPTRPKSPNFRLAARMRSHQDTRASLPPNAMSGFNRAADQEGKPIVRRRPSVTEPKSPVFRSRGPSRRYSVENDSPRKFVPTPLPSFLRNQNTLPSIKLNVKTRAAMEARTNPQARRLTAPPPATIKINMEPTVPKPFALSSVQQHEHYRQSLQAREAMLEDQARRRRSFVANKINPAILAGPTFVPARSSVPLTEPVDLLPFASERSERTLEYERKQRERIAQKERDEEMARRMREEEEELRIKMEMMQSAFKPKPVPRSHYVPHTISSRTNSERSGNATFALSASSEARPPKATRTAAAQEETSRPIEDEAVSPPSHYEMYEEIEAGVPNQETVTDAHSATATPATNSATNGDEGTNEDEQSIGEEESIGSENSNEDEQTETTAEEPHTPSQFDVGAASVVAPKSGNDHGSESSKSKSSKTESTSSGSAWFMTRMRKSLSPILGGTSET